MRKANLCGRFARYSALSDFSQAIDGLNMDASDELALSYNVAPSQRALVVRNVPEGRVASALFWGLMPSWIKNTAKNLPINARSEAVNERPMFRRAFRNQRCLVLCDGYYEWKKQVNGAKQPYYLQCPDGAPFALAGLWERNEHLGRKPLETFCILTTSAGAAVDGIHQRMPIRLTRDNHSDWLDPKMCDTKSLSQMMAVAEDDWSFYQVHRYVNNPYNDSNLCLERLHKIVL